MKGYRFYLEHESPQHKRKNEHTGNVFALYVGGERPWRYSPEGLGAVFSHPNSPVCWTGASLQWLSGNCKRISETKAREIHAELFARLDN